MSPRSACDEVALLVARLCLRDSDLENPEASGSYPRQTPATLQNAWEA